MNENIIYDITLQNALGAGCTVAYDLVESFNGAKNVLLAGEHELKFSGLLRAAQIERILHAQIDEAQKIYNYCKKYDVDIISAQDETFPQKLLNIPAPPILLYVRGELPDSENELLIAMVGTRHASEYGRNVAKRLSIQLACAGAVIVSGGAVGVDSCCHAGALTAGGKTVAVLGCGLDYRYNMDGAQLRAAIAKNGALVSEYPPLDSALPFHFPLRNRLISGLSMGTVVIEAGERSGSLITANHAAEQGRDVFAIPGSVMAPSFKGTNKLLRDGVKPVFSAMDILCEYERLFPEKLNMDDADTPIGEVKIPDLNREREKRAVSADENKKNSEFLKPICPKDLSRDALMVYNAFICAEMTFDEIVEGCTLDSKTVLCALTEMEMLGMVYKTPGNAYRIHGL